MILGLGCPPPLDKNFKMHGEDNVIILKVMGLDEIRLKWWRSKHG